MSEIKLNAWAVLGVGREMLLFNELIAIDTSPFSTTFSIYFWS